MSLAAGLPDGRRGQALALAMTVCAALLVWLGIVGPAQDWFADREERLSHQHAYARRAAALVATLPALRHEAEDLGKDGS